ncbi:MAG TPA: M1 family metallopeptidase [Chitinophagaceae bacterium]|nr:M1 family metallopeptidase [Chitinophagaceae bacterium]
MKMKIISIVLLIIAHASITQCTTAQPLHNKQSFTRQDSLRGSITKERAWWDLLRYDITVTPDYNSRSIAGVNKITFYDSGGYTMQIDLQQPMIIDRAVFDSEEVKFKREGNVYWLFLRDSSKKYKIQPGVREIVLSFHGTPRPAVNPPWDGGWVWQKDQKGRPWMSVACQGLGASVWYPCKDHQADEPQKGASITINVPDSLVAVANGKLSSKNSSNGITAYTWEVVNPINNYTIIPYIGKYVNWTETYAGEKGNLNCSYWVLDYNLQPAKKQFNQVPQMLKAFEHWFGPFPFYEDDFKLIDAPYLGMEHQSAIAYGNKYLNGYLGSDLSGSGWGLKWDYIIVHESGHEWFANNITTKDIADMWVHEGFTTYSETIFTEYHYGKEAGNAYLQGIRKNIQNEKPIIGPYRVNQSGSSDMYHKGANLIHTIRQVINDDEKFRSILRGMNKEFYHQTVTTRQVEQYISGKSGKDLSKVFDQYLRTTQIPVLELKRNKEKIEYRWTNCISNFNMPVKLSNGRWIQPLTQWTKLKVDGNDFRNIDVDPNFYIKLKKS